MQECYYKYLSQGFQELYCPAKFGKVDLSTIEAIKIIAVELSILKLV